MKFCVVGSGIIGLSTASELLAQYPSADVTIVSDKFGEDTTSNGAAGIFRPGGGFSVVGDTTGAIRKTWLKDSWDYYNAVCASSEAPSLHGIKSVSGYMFSSESDLTKNDLLSDVVPTYRSATEDELKICPGDWKYGSYFSTLVVDSQFHLKYLRAKIDGRVKIYQTKLNNFKELGKYDYIFNCTGLGSKWLCADDKVVPIRGQVYKVKAPWIKMFFYSNSDTYIIPGMNTVTLGGTRQFDNYNLQVDPHDSAGIWERATQLLPNLKRSDIVREWVGLRPYRDGGVRSELEIIKDGSKQLKVIHNYGHGGYGVTFAPGSCKYSVKTFTESHRGIWKLWRSKI